MAIEAISLLVWPLASLVGLVAAVAALQSGGNQMTSVLTVVGTMATIVVFFMLSLRVFFRAIAGAIPWTPRTKNWVVIIFGLVALGLGGWILAAAGNRTLP